MHVEVIRTALGRAVAFAVLRGPGYRKLIVNTDQMEGRPLDEREREAAIADLVGALRQEIDVPRQQA